MLELRHDGCARRTLMRDARTSYTAPCRKCGATLRVRHAYYYGWRPDDRLAPMDRATMIGPFCGISCWETYTAP